MTQPPRLYKSDRQTDYHAQRLCHIWRLALLTSTRAFHHPYISLPPDRGSSEGQDHYIIQESQGAARKATRLHSARNMTSRSNSDMFSNQESQNKAPGSPPTTLKQILDEDMETDSLFEAKSFDSVRSNPLSEEAKLCKPSELPPNLEFLPSPDDSQHMAKVIRELRSGCIESPEHYSTSKEDIPAPAGESKSVDDPIVAMWGGQNKSAASTSLDLMEQIKQPSSDLLETPQRNSAAKDDTPISAGESESAGDRIVAIRGRQNESIKPASTDLATVGKEPRSRASVAKKKPYECRHCEISFRDRCGRERHESIVHHKRRPFKCQKCHRPFGEKSGLKRHIREVHDRIRSYICSFCKSTFTRRDILKSHVKRIHGNDKAFKCNICSVGFVQEKDLANHCATVHDIKYSLLCNICYKRFSRKSTLANHLKAHKNTDSE